MSFLRCNNDTKAKIKCALVMVTIETSISAIVGFLAKNPNAALIMGGAFALGHLIIFLNELCCKKNDSELFPEQKPMLV